MTAAKDCQTNYNNCNDEKLHGLAPIIAALIASDTPTDLARFKAVWPRCKRHRNTWGWAYSGDQNRNNSNVSLTHNIDIEGLV